jgi:NAD(P)-dependent dehydrogenase (short-subunit alcohol dehydrogenase family)
MAHVLIIGASGGIGSALARRLHADGHSLTLSSRDAERLADLAGELDAKTVELDATDRDATEQTIAKVAKDAGRLDGVVNLAGSILLKPAHSTSDDEFRTTIETNLHTAFNVVAGAAKVMTQQKADDDNALPEGGSIVLMSSAVASHGYPAHEAISAAKAGVEALARSASASYASKGVRVNAVAPGLTDSPMSAHIMKSEAMKKASLDMHADGKVGTVEQCASALQWLLHPEQCHVFGQVIAVDGGLSRVHAK